VAFVKHVKAVIRPEMLENVRAALEKEGCCNGVTISEVMGQGKQKGVVQVWRGEKFHLDLLPKVMMDMVVKDEDVPIIKRVIIESAAKGDCGDGKIFIYDVAEVVRIRTGEEGEDAL
jgi:nitrogen regulatory protein P-II 1